MSEQFFCSMWHRLRSFSHSQLIVGLLRSIQDDYSCMNGALVGMHRTPGSAGSLSSPCRYKAV